MIFYFGEQPTQGPQRQEKQNNRTRVRNTGSQNAVNTKYSGRSAIDQESSQPKVQ